MAGNIFFRIRAKERKSKGIVRTNHRVIKSIICQDDVQFVKIWEVQSASTCVYDNNRIYFDNYRTCVTECGHEGKPSILYRLPKCPTSQKIEDALICQYHPEDISEGTRPHLIALTKDNWIVRHHLDTGLVLQRVYLHSRLNYNYLNWNEGGSSFVVKTTKSKSTATMRNADVQSNVLLTLAVFTVYPLELKACMEIDKRVFGDDIIGANLDGENILFTLHQRNVIRFYSFQRILEEYTVDAVKLGDDFPDGGADGCKVGEAPLGIPITLKLTERPAVLFEVSCHDHDVQFGGFPWHFMMSPRSVLDPTTIKVCNLATKEEAINGTMERNSMLATGAPGAIFHLDGSDRIINTKLRSLNVFKIRRRDNGQCELVLDHVINPWPYEGKAYLEEDARDFCPHRIMYSHKGRPFVASHDLFDGDGLYEVLSSQMISSFICEDDLDILAVTMPTNDMNEDRLYGYVTLHDTGTGRLLKMIRIPGEWDDTVEHQISFDMDTLVHTFKNQSGRWYCQVFHAQRKNVFDKGKKGSRKKAVATKGHRRSKRR